MVKRCPEFTGSIVPNETRMTSYYYASKPILKVPKNPKCIEFVIKDGRI
ncbi:MAG: hypothetical protein OXC46_01435 [Thaumarchaeota archaeon]|nr:hypothetical protein [Nitrososphaerota archaeon]